MVQEVPEFIKLCFLLSYKLKISYDEVLDMPFKVFMWYVQELSELLEAEERASKGKPPRSKMSDERKSERRSKLQRLIELRRG
ncbi:MAG: hypothetical protein DRJ03_24995 [Chloroflexi bacterium]|nr:MAG: hypothetical protein DRJ03_24995 [Chloroflexota bacterium]